MRIIYKSLKIGVVLCLVLLLLFSSACNALVISPSTVLKGIPAITMISAQPGFFQALSPMPSSSVNRSPFPQGASIQVQVANINLVNKIGFAKIPGEGHLIYYLDVLPPTIQGRPATTSGNTSFETSNTSYTWYNISLSLHTFSVQVVNNDGTPLSPPVVASIINNLAQINNYVPNFSSIGLISALVRSKSHSGTDSTLSSGISETGFDVTIQIGASVGDAPGQTDPTEIPPQARYYLDRLPPTIPNQLPINGSGISAMVPSPIYTWHNVPPGLHAFAAEIVNPDGASEDPPQAAAIFLDVEASAGIAFYPPTPTSTSSATSSSIPQYSITSYGEWIGAGGGFSIMTAGQVNNRDYLFLASIAGTIVILDLQKQDSPVRTSYLKSSDSIKDLDFSNGILCVSTYNSLWIIDVSDPASPKALSKLTSIMPLNTTISGHYAYVNDNGEKITTVDISDPGNPKVLNSLILEPQASIKLIKASGNLLVAIPVGWNGGSLPVSKTINNGFYFIDISSPGSPRQINYFPNPAPSVPMPAGQTSHPVPAAFKDIAIAGKNLFLSTNSVDGTLIFDISNPARPREVSHTSQPSSMIVVSQNWLYFYLGKGLGVTNIHNLDNPRVIKYAIITDDNGGIIDNPYALMNLGSYLYLLSRGGLKVIGTDELNK